MRNNLENNKKVIWLTGLSGAGKSTLSLCLASEFDKNGLLTKVLDGDDLRKGLNNNLGFSIDDRLENIRRAAEVAKLFLNADIQPICSFITPLNQMRTQVRSIIGNENLIEIYVKCSLETCEKRDVKGLYEKVRRGEINNFTGINSDFEIPITPDLIVDTEKFSIEECINQIKDFIDFKD